MDASPLLDRIARALAECRLQAVLVGNAAAALHGAPVTTLDFDFMFRKTPLNRCYVKEKPRKPRKKDAQDALRKESERAAADQIRRLLQLPMERRTHFLRVRSPGGGSHL